MSWSDIDALLNVHPIVMAQVILIKVSNSLIHNKKVDPLAIFNSGFHDKIYFVSLQLNSEKQKKTSDFSQSSSFVFTLQQPVVANLKYHDL